MNDLSHYFHPPSSDEMEAVRKDFDGQWEAGTFPGWPKETSGSVANFILSISLITLFARRMNFGEDFGKVIYIYI